MVIDTTKLENGKDNALLKDLEDTLYGTDGTGAKEPSLPTPDEVIDIMGGSTSASS